MVRRIFQEVVELIEDYQDPNCNIIFISVSDDEWYQDSSCVHFIVTFFYYDEDYYDEMWYIDYKGIHTKNEIYKTVEDFRAGWCI